jgi:hypothetical protein
MVRSARSAPNPTKIAGAGTGVDIHWFWVLPEAKGRSRLLA